MMGKKNNHNLPENRYDLQILQSLRRIIRSVDMHSRKLSMQHDITVPQLIVLLAVVEYGPLTVAAIAKRVYLSPSTLVGVVDRLEAKQYVVRKRSLEDRRQVMVFATDKGKNFASSAPSPLQETLAKALNALAPLEQATIAFSLQKVVELMEAKELDAPPILQSGIVDEDVV